LIKIEYQGKVCNRKRDVVNYLLKNSVLMANRRCLSNEMDESREHACEILSGIQTVERRANS